MLLLKKIEELLKDDKKYIVLRAPTGIGKSAICTTISSYFSSQQERSYLLCSRKYLQSQYMDDYSRVYANFWGKANYTCPLISASCSGCPADSATDSSAYMRFLRHNCTSKKVGDKCPYIRAREAAQQAKSSLLNIEAFLANSLSGCWNPREIMLVDEAHCISDRAASFFEVKLRDAWCTLPQTFKDRKATDPTTKRFNLSSPEIKSVLKDYRESLKEFSEEKLSVSRDLLHSINYLEVPGLEWVYAYETKTLIPINVKLLLEKYLFSYAEKVILLSATLTPNLCKELGMNSQNSTFIDIDSTFPMSHCELKYLPRIGSLNMGNLQSKADTLAACILKARIEHINKRGIVHTVSYKLVEIIKSALEDQAAKFAGQGTLEDFGFIFHTKGTNLETLLEMYKKKPGSVLVTPSLGEGFDGLGKLLEWQILLKCPYPYLGEPRIKALVSSKFGSTLFRERAISSILQAIGRGIRSKEDTCTTYILDRNIATLLGKCSRKGSEHYSSTSRYFKELWRRRKTS